MKLLTEILSKEHENILKFIDVLLKKCEIMEKKKEIDKDFFEEAINFIRNYADKFHHAKEENILFKELCKDTVEMRCNPVEQMLYEHDLGRNFVKGIEDGLKKKDISKIIKNSKGYADLLREHIYKEDNILYPMAEQSLGKAIKIKILKEFERIKKSKDKDKALAFLKSFKNEKF